MMIERNPPDFENEIAIGKILKPHGLLGEVRVLAFADQPPVWEDLDSVFIRRKNLAQSYQIEQIRPTKGDIFLVKFAGFETRDDAETIQGGIAYIQESQLPKLEEGEYYTYQLVGLKVETPEGENIGEVVSVEPGPANDLLIVKGPGGKFPLPTSREFVKVVDIANGRIVASLIEGLCELEV